MMIKAKSFLPYSGEEKIIEQCVETKEFQQKERNLSDLNKGEKTFSTSEVVTEVQVF